MDKHTTPTFAAPAAVDVPLRSGTITVSSAAMGPLLRVKALIVPVLDELVAEAPRIFDQARLDMIVATQMITANDIADLCVLLEQLDVVADLAAELSGLTRVQVLSLLPDEFAYLCAVVVQVNADFFVQALPAFSVAAQRVVDSGVWAKAARTLGTSSSPQHSTA